MFKSAYNNNSTTDRSLEKLKEAENLEILDLSYSSDVTDETIRRLVVSGCKLK